MLLELTFPEKLALVFEKAQLVVFWQGLLLNLRSIKEAKALAYFFPSLLSAASPPILPLTLSSDSP